MPRSDSQPEPFSGYHGTALPDWLDSAEEFTLFDESTGEVVGVYVGPLTDLGGGTPVPKATTGGGTTTVTGTITIDADTPEYLLELPGETGIEGVYQAFAGVVTFEPPDGYEVAVAVVLARNTGTNAIVAAILTQNEAGSTISVVLRELDGTFISPEEAGGGAYEALVPFTVS